MKISNRCPGCGADLTEDHSLTIRTKQIVDMPARLNTQEDELEADGWCEEYQGMNMIEARCKKCDRLLCGEDEMCFSVV